MTCTGCGLPLTDPWGQCNLTPTDSYHQECCPGCARHVVSKHVQPREIADNRRRRALVREVLGQHR